jgi:hypothetical protein
MRRLPVILILGIGGCFTPAATIVQTPSDSWSRRDCLTVMVSSMRHNLNDNASNVRAIVTPYVPKVVEAIARMQQLKSGAGLFIDRENQRKLVNAKGNYIRSPGDLDSLLFMVSLNNRSWPCNPPLHNVQIFPGIYAIRPLAGIADWPCYIPEITDLDRRIFLVNARGDTLMPKFLWGRNNNVLTMEEHVFAMFDFTRGTNRGFLKEGDEVFLVIAGFDRPIHFSFPLAEL